MKTIQMEIDDALLDQIERTTQANGMTTSEFICNAVKLILKQSSVSTLEKQHQDGYRKQPVSKDEFDAWETEQVWGDK